MPRNGSGTYSIPNTFTPSSVIASSAMNANFSDIATEVTNSPALDGQSTMTGQFKAASGSVGAPGMAFGSDLDCGWYRIGANNIGGAVNGTKILDIATTGLGITGALDVSGALTLGTDLAIAQGGTGQSSAVAAFNALSPVTTRGDLIKRGAANNERLAIGANTTILQSDGTDPAWVALATALATLTELATLTKAGGLQLLAAGNAAGATLDIPLTDFTGYRGIKILLIGIIPQTDGAELNVLVSTDGGANYDGSGYNFSLTQIDDLGNTAILNSGSTSAIRLATDVGSAATEGYDGELTILGQTSTARWAKIRHNGTHVTNAATPGGFYTTGYGQRETAQDTDAIRILFSTGNIASGSYAVYGYA